MFENKKIKDVHATRYIMSWIRVGGSLSMNEGCDDFEKWLKSLELTEEEIDYIWQIARNGKMELEHSARKFLSK